MATVVVPAALLVVGLSLVAAALVRQRDAQTPRRRGVWASAELVSWRSPWLARLLLAAAAATSAAILTGLAGFVILLAGAGWFLPVLLTGPRRRRAQLAEATAWRLWARQLCDLVRAGDGLQDALRASAGTAPPALAPLVGSLAATADVVQLEASLDVLARSPSPWAAQISAGLRIAVRTGGELAEPLLTIAQRIEDVTDVHRARTAAASASWLQTLILLGLCGVTFGGLWLTTPDYYRPYTTPVGQLIFALLMSVIVGCFGFLAARGIVAREAPILGSEGTSR